MTVARKVALAAANVISQAVNSRTFFFDHFQQNSGDDIKRIQWCTSEEVGSTIEMRLGGAKKRAKQESCSLEDRSFVLILILLELPTGITEGHAQRTTHRQSHKHRVLSKYNASVGIRNC